ncbi:pentapeptide repeat-containing protein [Acaryochloris sp. IP29b_bin.137]|uniref:pentapeptide repeat-containing protein n=1 Tax=Acaryochloris sp. IP29b_bin.137 TaxID=2969217 RepID=UPI00344B33E0
MACRDQNNLRETDLREADLTGADLIRRTSQNPGPRRGHFKQNGLPRWTHRQSGTSLGGVG